MLIDADFRPEVGYVRRSDIRRSFGQVRFSPRPRRSKSIRKFTWQGSFDYVTDAPAIALQSKEASGLFRIEFQSSDQFSAEYSHEFELLPNRFAIAPGVIVPAGGYSYSTSRVSLLARPAAPGVGAAERLDRHAVRRHEVRRVVLRKMGVIPQFQWSPA
jgi:hypothetical protein